MLPRMVLRVRRAVGRLASHPEKLAPSGPETQARWDAMIARLDAPRRDAERRLAEVERALNRLGLD